MSLKPVEILSTSGLQRILGKKPHVILGSHWASSVSLTANNFPSTLWCLCYENGLVNIWSVLVIPPAGDSPAFLTEVVGKLSTPIWLDPPGVGKGVSLLLGTQRQQANSHPLFLGSPKAFFINGSITCNSVLHVIESSLFPQRAIVAQNEIQPLELTHL